MDIADDISKYRVTRAPPDVYYIPNFISIEEEDEILKHVYGAPKPKWTYLSNRRLQDYGGVPHKRGMISEEIPQWLQKYMDRINDLSVFDKKFPNQVLVNEYIPGQGIMPHTDGPLFHPIVTTISCGSHTILNFLENNVQRDKICEFLLERRSLIIIKNDMYTKYLHSIDETKFDVISDDTVNLEYCCGEYNTGETLERQTRISVTIRNVPKVLKVKITT
ncbi:alpha-ketoglutarate-dependent dioxygenase alkB homolog 6 [Coccinella septempunctata]|uniref:alpha-ketoglutarate-dependent dioxygenase alkB homolog 6 n=1 Tax=Coccinella septempunctata TaxID=41139 RepID=UPI001D07A425|nr:alpha-ketoglutarate-dependent dioxygenase alkB homolog 6 [Coccinella septempunctata]